MKSRFLVAGAIALGSLTVSTAHAAAPTEIVYQGPSVLQVGVATDLTAHLLELPSTRVSAPLLTFTLDGVTKSATGNADTGIATASMKAVTLGEDRPLTIGFAGTAAHAASNATVPVDVYESVLLDETGGGMLLLNPSRSELRVVSGAYDSGLLTGVQLLAAGPGLVIDVDRADANGQRLVLKGVAAPSRGSFAVAGLATEPIVLARA